MDFFPDRFGKASDAKHGLSPVGDLLMLVWRDYLKHFREYLRLSALTLIGFPLMGPAIAWSIVGVDPSGEVLTAEPKQVGWYFALLTVTILVLAATHILAQAALNISVAAEAGGKHKRWLEAVRAAKHVFWPFAATMVVLYVLVTFPVELDNPLLFILGGIIGVYLLFAEPIAALEGTGPIEALRRSARLVSGRFWPVLWRTVIGYAIISLIALTLSFPFVQILSSAIGSVFTDNFTSLRIAMVLPTLFGAAITALVLPLFVSLQVHLYGQLKRQPKRD